MHSLLPLHKVLILYIYHDKYTVPLPWFWHQNFELSLYYRRTGKALTFITRENWRWARDLCNVLAQANQVL